MARTRKQLRSDLRARLSILAGKVSDEELNHWLDLGSHIVAGRIYPFIRDWFTSYSPADVSGATIGEVSEISDSHMCTVNRSYSVVGAYGSSGTADWLQLNKQIPIMTLQELYVAANNTNYDNETLIAFWGNKMYIYVGSGSSVLTNAEIDVWSLKEVAGFASDSSTITVPTEYTELVVQYAQACALAKAGQYRDSDDIQDSMNQAVGKLRESFISEIKTMQQTAPAGMQSPVTTR